MIEPVLALQAAIRNRLIGKSEVLDLVTADHIRAGSSRPDDMPCIIIADGTTTLHGHGYTSQHAAWVYLDIHVWTLDAEPDAAKEIAGTVVAALSKYNLTIDGGYCDHFEVTTTRHHRDPNPAYGHSTVSVEALIRWIV